MSKYVYVIESEGAPTSGVFTDYEEAVKALPDPKYYTITSIPLNIFWEEWGYEDRPNGVRLFFPNMTCTKRDEEMFNG